MAKTYVRLGESNAAVLLVDHELDQSPTTRTETCMVGRRFFGPT